MPALYDEPGFYNELDSYDGVAVPPPPPPPVAQQPPGMSFAGGGGSPPFSMPVWTGRKLPNEPERRVNAEPAARINAKEDLARMINERDEEDLIQILALSDW